MVANGSSMSTHAEQNECFGSNLNEWLLCTGTLLLAQGCALTEPEGPFKARA